MHGELTAHIGAIVSLHADIGEVPTGPAIIC
jgi:hypothetical protein